jgi:hypothetical protein
MKHKVTKRYEIVMKTNGWTTKELTNKRNIISKSLRNEKKKKTIVTLDAFIHCDVFRKWVENLNFLCMKETKF